MEFEKSLINSTLEDIKNTINDDPNIIQNILSKPYKNSTLEKLIIEILESKIIEEKKLLDVQYVELIMR